MTTGPKDWSPWYSRWPQDIFDSSARAIFVSAWADREEEEGRTHSGEELMDVAPATPMEAQSVAAELFKATETLNREPIEKLYERARKAGNKPLESSHWRDQFGHLLAMQALGHGVGLSDEFEGHKIRVPAIEFHLF